MNLTDEWTIPNPPKFNPLEKLKEIQGMNKLDERIQDLIASKEIHTQYLTQKLSEHDWHGVADAAMDIRDIEAELKGLKIVKETKM